MLIRLEGRILLSRVAEDIFNTFYTWISAHHSLIVSYFADFLFFYLCSSFSSK